MSALSKSDQNKIITKFRATGSDTNRLATRKYSICSRGYTKKATCIDQTSSAHHARTHLLGKLLGEYHKNETLKRLYIYTYIFSLIRKYMSTGVGVHDTGVT